MSESIFKNPYVIMGGAGIGGAILGAGITAFIKSKAIKQLKKEVSRLKQQPTTPPVQKPTEQAQEEVSPVESVPVEVDEEQPNLDDGILQLDISEEEEDSNFHLPAILRFAYIRQGPNLNGLTERQANQMRAMAENRLDMCSKKKFVSAEEFRQHLKGMYAQYHRYLEQNKQEQESAA